MDPPSMPTSIISGRAAHISNLDTVAYRDRLVQSVMRMTPTDAGPCA
jgi:hypothetical protein